MKKDKQEKITVKKVILNGNFIVSFLVAIAIVFSPDAGAIADLHIRQEDVPKGWMVWDERGWSTGEAPDVK